MGGAPYPGLVSLGTDASGRVLVDLEAAQGLINIRGSQTTAALAALAVELATNLWSDRMRLTLVGFGHELTAIAPDRVRAVGGLAEVLPELEAAAAPWVPNAKDAATSMAPRAMDLNMFPPGSCFRTVRIPRAEILPQAYSRFQAPGDIVNSQRVFSALLWVMLGAALASGMAWLVNPVYTISWAGVFSNDGLAFAAIMVASALYLLAVSLADEPANRLAGVSFGMRHLLIATTLVAAVLATGPIGYVTLLTLVAGLSMFAVFYYFHRTSASSGAPSP